MANNHGGSGSKFVSVNLNKLYGQPSHNNNSYPPHSGSYGPGVGTNGVRPGGMVVLSRNRPLQKAVPKLSVPPPLNLPSLRKEYEKTDSSGAGGGVAGGAGSGSGSRPSSSGMGWTKPGNVAFHEKEVSETQGLESVNYTEVAVTKGSGAYMPPSARFGGGIRHGDTGSTHRLNVASVERAMVLRGEDFPSLRAALPQLTGAAQKQKEGSFQKPKQLVSEELSSNDLKNSSRFSSPAHIQSSNCVSNCVNENNGQSPSSRSVFVDHARKQEDPLLLIRLNPRSDWADDERDTGYGFAVRSSRDQELPKSETYWDRDFDVPRSSILPHKPPNNLSERRVLPVGVKGSTSEVLKTEPFRREMNLHSREDVESNSWRHSSVHKDRLTGPHAVNEGNSVTLSDRFSNAHHGQGRQGGQRHWNQSVESPRYRNEGYQNSAGAKSIFSLGSREKSSFSKNERTYIDDPYQKDFSSSVYDERDPFTGNLVGVMKRKKEVSKQAYFHDPVRESFEAELERVQKMQEMERQRVVEEQERVLEQTQREDEERRMVIFEEEERRKRMEEEAREASWRAEQERLDTIQKAEELRISREEEKKRMNLEEERRKQAAKLKLLELEAKMAKREAEVGKSGTADEEVPVGGKYGDASMDSDLDNWEVSQRMVERITTSVSSDSSAIDRPFDQPQFSREVSSNNFVDGTKPVNPWKRNAFEVGGNSSFLINDQEYGHLSPKQDPPLGGRSFPKKDLYYGFPHLGDRDQRWNSFGDGESYGSRNRDIESEFYENVGEKYGEVGWGQGYSRNSPRSPYQDQLFMNSYERSRYSMKQPRVLPPPSLSSVPKSSVRGENELSGPLSSLESRTGNYGGPQDTRQQSDLGDLQQEFMAQNLDKNDKLRCDSQSSLSVSSPPSSPNQLSHDELDDSVGCLVIPEGKKDVVNDDLEKVTTMTASKSISADEDEEWSLENHDEMQEQEEYDEDDGYGEEEEVHEGPDENNNLTQEFEHMHLEEKNTTNVIENLVLGFNEGVEVRIPDEFERDCKTDVNTIDKPEQKQGAVDEPQNACTFGDPTVSSSQHIVSSMVEIASTMPASDLPIKLHFGLFSEPSLIPSPVPAIQIGSIQMPLHLHPSIGSQIGHMNPSQPPPLFQFGQLRYTSSVSQGILPMAPQPISLIQPNIQHTHFNLNQNSATFLPNQFSQENSAINMKNDDNVNRTSSKPVTQAEEKGLSSEKNLPLSKASGPSYPNKGKRTAYPARNSGQRSFQAYESSPNEFRKHRRPIQRTEFRVRENANNSSGLNDKLNNNNGTRSGCRRNMVSNNSSMKRVIPEALAFQEKETAKKTQSVEGNLKRNIQEEDVDAPLQSGVVRVFKQPGIECPSDEDDFIEVRSKRQMLNDRREQREKEIKAKSRVIKQPRKTRPFVQNKISASLIGESSNNIHSDFVRKEPSTDFSTMASQPLAPIGTPTVDTDVQTGIRLHTNKILQRGSTSGVLEDHCSNLMFETENKVVDNVESSSNDLDNARMDQLVIPLTQTQFDEAMKPARFNTTHVTSIGDHTTLVNEAILPSSSISTKGKSVSSPINSLLAGEKIQFGAVTSPTVLPPNSNVVSHVIGTPGSFRSDKTQNNSKAENDCNIFFKKDEHSTEDCKVKVEAVSVAAIDPDGIVGNGMGPVSDSAESIQGVDQHLGSKSKPEESLTVSLPADLSVETPLISLWPQIQSPQGSSTQMLSHFHGPTPSHFPFYEMNHGHPMMSGPVFTFGPHEESGGTRSQPQKSTGPSGSRHIGGPWQNHSNMDSFYSPPAGFTGSFIGSPGGMPGVQAPPHMVVYNHYAPVGQFGQVGLSFMGATYVPSGKQPDWKHDPTSSGSGRSEEDMNTMNMVSGPRNPPNMQPPIQHLAPGSPLMPMGSPLTMFDVPPFQTTPDMLAQGRWSHVPASPLYAVPMSLPLQQQAEATTGPGPSQFSSQSAFPHNRFSEPQTSSTLSNSNGMVFPVVRDSIITHFPDELGMVDSSGTSVSTSSVPVTISHISSGTTNTGDGVQRGGISNQHHQQGKNLSSQQQYNNNNNQSVGGYGYQRGGGVSPKNKSVGQWAHRRTGGFHGRYQSMGQEKSFAPSTKVKQIYVAKQPAASGGSSSNVG